MKRTEKDFPCGSAEYTRRRQELEQRLQAIAGQVRQLEVSLQRHDDCQRWYNRSKRSASMSHRVWQQIRFVICDWTIETVFRLEKSELAIETIRVWMRKKRNKLLQLVSEVA